MEFGYFTLSDNNYKDEKRSANQLGSVAPHIFESAEEAHAFVRGAGRS